MSHSQPSVRELTEDAELLFRRVSGSASGTLEQHAAGLGWSPARAARVVGDLLELRLVRAGPDGLLRAEDPRASVGRLLEAEEAALDQRRRRLLDLRQRVDGLEADYRRGMRLSAPLLPAWEEVPRAEEAAVLEQLTRSVPGPVLHAGAAPPVLHAGAAPPVVAGDSADPAAARERRLVLPVAALADEQRDPQGRAGVELRRYLEKVPVEVTVLGRSAALLRPTTCVGEGLLLVRAPVLVDAMTALFEALWQRAHPAYDGPADPGDTRLLELLALGLKDEAIGRAMGLSVRTVRRRVAAQMAEAGVDTRFQLGLAVARRGVLGDIQVGGVDRVGRSVVSW